MKLQLRDMKALADDVSSKKRLILYGTIDETQGIKRLIELYGGKVEYIIDNAEQNGMKSYVDLVYENPKDIYVLVCKKEYIQACKHLDEIGLTLPDHYRVIFKPRYGNIYEKYPLDVNIGYTSAYPGMNYEYPGLTIFGNDANEHAYRIVTLGGSTSDSQAFLWKCWSQLLYERIRKNKDVIIFSAGVSGYRSSQELIKLERDILNIKPDLVISFSGVNDTGESDYPFVQCYSQTVFERFCSANLTDMGGEYVTSYTSGFKKVGTMAYNWIRNERIMNAICREFGVKFYCFLQPMIGNKIDKLSRQELELVVNDGEEDILQRTSLFLNNAKKLLKENIMDFIYDISDLFDDEDSVYIDGCHVNENGNRMIADRIYKEIQKELSL